MLRTRRILALTPVALAVASLLVTSGCTKERTVHGYVVDQELLASVQPGVDNKQSIRQALGDPTLVAQWDDNVWYYISRVTSQFAYNKPKLRDETALIVTFDDSGVVRNVERRGMEQVVSINPNRNKTKTEGHREGIFEALFGNIGAVGAAGGPAGPGGP